MIGTRTTHAGTARASLAYMQQAYSRSADASARLSSGKRIQRPSDDPSGVVAAMSLRSDARAQVQFARNGDDGIGWLSVTDNALQQALNELRGAQQSVLQASNHGAMNAQSRQALAAEVRAARDNLLSLANTTYLDRPVFGGATTGSTAFEAGTDPATGAYTATYTGDSGMVQRRLDNDTQIRVDTPGEDVFVLGGTTLFAMLDSIATNIESNPQALAADLDSLAAAHQQVSGHLAGVGNRYQRVDSLRQAALDNELSLKASLSKVEDVDVPAAIMEMELASMAYQASLGATAKVMQPTLLDFLR
ncbi:MAG: flagellar hook-associated protein 3 [Micrococcales bacterium]|nr:MAG: flagellar hook-associated protein 3 [Micrococcales bacterium]PIE26576.1 MAG: flagellar hook-associated protein 3 [Micrococcales bacterium]